MYKTTSKFQQSHSRGNATILNIKGLPGTVGRKNKITKPDFLKSHSREIDQLLEGFYRAKQEELIFKVSKYQRLVLVQFKEQLQRLLSKSMISQKMRTTSEAKLEELDRVLCWCRDPRSIPKDLPPEEPARNRRKKKTRYLFRP